MGSWVGRGTSCELRSGTGPTRSMSSGACSSNQFHKKTSRGLISWPFALVRLFGASRSGRMGQFIASRPSSDLSYSGHANLLASQQLGQFTAPDAVESPGL